MKYFFFLLAFLGLSIGSMAQSSYKEMMNDPSVNFYDVVKAAERYFDTHEKGEGSGYKVISAGRQRMKPSISPQETEAKWIHFSWRRLPKDPQQCSGAKIHLQQRLA